MAKSENKAWYGVDFDGTLAVYESWKGFTHCGVPIFDMVTRVKYWLSLGRNVRILTARAYAPPDDALAQRNAAKAIIAIQDWCLEHIGATLPVTCTKDYDMIELWDDRAVQVERNTGRPVI